MPKKDSKRKLTKITISLLSIFNLSTTGTLKAEDVLRIGAIPDQNPEHLNRLYKVLSSELSEQLNIKVQYIPVTNYAAAVTAFRTGDLDLVWFGALTGVQARLQRKRHLEHVGEVLAEVLPR